MLTLRQIITFALGLSLFFGGCGSKGDVRDLGTRAVIIGIDGADWKLIDALEAEGALPNLARVRARSAWGKIETLNDLPLSPVIWTSVATGKAPAKHGISWFMVDRPDGTRVPVRSHNRKVKALWNILAEHGRWPAVVGWWATYPAERIEKGTIVSDGLGFHGFGSTAREDDDKNKVYPASLFDEMNAQVPPDQQISADFARRFIHLSPEEYRAEMFNPARFPERNPLNPIHLFQQYAVTAQGYTGITEELLAERAWDLFMVYFEQVDSFSHLFMKYAPPKLDWVDEAEFERYKDLVNEWYKYQDELLGRVLAGIDLEETAVFILSDHGFKSGERRIRSEETVDVKKAHLDHEIHGIFIAAGPHIRSGMEVEGISVLDITPTVLHYLGFPVAKDMDGKVQEEVFEPKFLTDHPIRYVSTYEDEQAAGEAVTDAEDYGEEKLAKNLKALRALGYVQDSSKEGESGVGPDAAGEESSPELHNNLGRIHLRNGELDKARRAFRQALELDPDNAETLLNIGNILRTEGRALEAERLVERALQVNPNSTGALSHLAEIKRDQGELDEAIRLFEEALAIDNSQPVLYLGYGDVLQRADRFQAAERAFRSVLELEPDSFRARYNLGVTYGNQRKLDEAVRWYDEALEVDPKNPDATQAWNNLGAIHLARGEVDKAQERFEQAVEAAPANLEAHYNLALIYLDNDRVEEAVELLEKAALLEPNHEIVNVRLAMAYLRVGRNQDAYKSFLLVRRLYPENWLAPIGLALFHAAAEDGEQARKFLDDALRLGGKQARATAAGYPLLKKLMETP